MFYCTIFRQHSQVIASVDLRLLRYSVNVYRNGKNWNTKCMLFAIILYPCVPQVYKKSSTS